MLPSPDIKVVRRGWKREKLYEKMFAISAVEIHDNMSENEIRQKLNKLFEKKISGFSEQLATKSLIQAVSPMMKR
jgi:molybdopterin biosynthesis enzyme MoaB